MATKVYMEALSPTMEEGRISSWLKNEGDEIAEGDVLAEVETDKATMELSARGAGVLRKRMLDEGGVANVGDVIAVIAAEDEDISDLAGGEPSGDGDEAAAEAPEKDEKKEKKEGEKPEAKAGGEAQEAKDSAERARAETDNGKRDGGRVKASPLARRLAEESGLELGSVEGSGPGGRIVKRDIEAALEGGPPAGEAMAPEVAVPTPEAGPADGAAYEDVPLSQMRKTIARRLSQSIGPVPHFFLTREVDMSEAMRLRKRLNERFADEGRKASVNDLVVKAAAMALRRHPWVNAAWTGDAVRKFNVVHIGIAVAVEEGLITPVVRDADRKGVMEIGAEVRELAARARDKKLKPEEYSGSTFSISNLGMFGIEEFTAVINPPEAAILAVGAVKEKPVAVDGAVLVQPRMRITLSCDHRVIDGATGAEFLQTLVAYLEDPMMMVA